MYREHSGQQPPRRTVVGFDLTIINGILSHHECADLPIGFTNSSPASTTSNPSSSNILQPTADTIKKRAADKQILNDNNPDPNMIASQKRTPENHYPVVNTSTNLRNCSYVTLAAIRQTTTEELYAEIRTYPKLKDITKTFEQAADEPQLARIMTAFKGHMESVNDWEGMNTAYYIRNGVDLKFLRQRMPKNGSAFGVVGAPIGSPHLLHAIVGHYWETIPQKQDAAMKEPEEQGKQPVTNDKTEVAPGSVAPASATTSAQSSSANAARSEMAEMAGHFKFMDYQTYLNGSDVTMQVIARFSFFSLFWFDIVGTEPDQSATQAQSNSSGNASVTKAASEPSKTAAAATGTASTPAAKSSQTDATTTARLDTAKGSSAKSTTATAASTQVNPSMSGTTPPKS